MDCGLNAYRKASRGASIGLLGAVGGHLAGRVGSTRSMCDARAVGPRRQCCSFAGLWWGM